MYNILNAHKTMAGEEHVSLHTLASCSEKKIPVLNDINDFLIKCGDAGATTREVSNACNISIYAARNWLIRLEECGEVLNIRISPRKNKWLKKDCESYQC